MKRIPVLKSKGSKGVEVRATAFRTLVFGLVGATIFAGLTALVPTSASNADTLGSLLTSSAQTVTAAQSDPYVSSAPFPDLKVTVSQTANLVSQGITIAYSGLKQSTRPTGDIGGENFLQIAQCWGEDPNNPGHPDRSTCQYGLVGNNSGVRDNYLSTDSVDPHDSQYSYVSSVRDGQSYTAIPFRAATGEEINSIQTNGDGSKERIDGVNMNQNQFFSPLTTNFIPWVGADNSGSGSSKFEIQTVMQSPGLGCGTPKVTGTTAVGQSCWLVIIPRGTHDNNQNYITTSGLFWDAWKHNIAIKLDFRPVGVRCAIGGVEHQLSGSELISAAVASWQPKLCAGSSGSAFVLSTGNESDALTSELSNPTAPLALTSEPLPNQGQDPLLYAPVAVSGVVVSLAIDRFVKTRGKVPPGYTAANYSPFSSINLTPRLLAKLLTNSYLDSLPPGDKTYLGYKNYLDTGPNADNITHDPDFLAVNDQEWKYQSILSVGLSDAIVPIGRSDLADRVWNYIMSDPDGRAFMEGTPDPWGMRINPWYCTDSLLNPTGTGLAVPRRDFPKADPIETKDTTVSDPAHGIGAIDLVSWRPYVSDFDTAAYKVIRGDAMLLGGWNPFSFPPAFAKSAGQLQGNQRVLALSTASSAFKYQNVTASLLNPAGNFVAPTQQGMFAAQASMVPTASNKNVLTYDFKSESAQASPNSYPLTMSVYAAVNPALLDASLRQIYANFIRFAASQGQTPGTDLGQLPPGYAPLSQGNVAQAMQVASLVSQGLTTIPTVVPTDVPTTSPSVSPTLPTSSSSPTPDGNSFNLVLGLPTPADPSSGPLSKAIPVGFAAGSILSLIYTRLNRRKRTKRNK